MQHLPELNFIVHELNQPILEWNIFTHWSRICT